MAFSSLEAIWKGVATQILNHCKRKRCKQCCEYIKEYNSITKINKAHFFPILIHLESARLLYFSPSEYRILREIANSRNYVQLFKQMTNEKAIPCFNKDAINECLDMFYKTIDQLFLLNDYYFNLMDNCLKELDGDCYCLYTSSFSNIFSKKLSTLPPYFFPSPLWRA